MYKIIGADEKEYGPISLEQMQQWIAQGRVNAQTRVQGPGAPDWRPAVEIPELQAYFSASRTSPPSSSTVGAMPPAPGTRPKQGLAITSLVLGILSILCLGCVTGVPAIICGHIAHNRARKRPAEYGGKGMAAAGFVMGYISVILTIIAGVMLTPLIWKSKGNAQSLSCAAQLEKIGLAHQMWALDHEGLFPPSVSTNSAGTKELATTDSEGFLNHPAVHLKVLANELENNPALLVCPSSTTAIPAMSFDDLEDENVSYRLRWVPNIETEMNEVLMVCPVHKHRLLSDGSLAKD